MALPFVFLALGLSEECCFDADGSETTEQAIDKEFGRAYGLAELEAMKAARIEPWEKALTVWRHVAT